MIRDANPSRAVFASVCDDRNDTPTCRIERYVSRTGVVSSVPSTRHATAADAAEMLRVHSASIRGLGPTHYAPEQVDAWDHDRSPDDYVEVIETDETPVLVAEADGAVVGFGWLDVDDEEIVAVYVHPDYAREGVGTALLEGLEATAVERGVESVELLASLNAVAFYEAAGYRAVDETVHTQPGDVDMTCVRMEKRLR